MQSNGGRRCHPFSENEVGVFRALTLIKRRLSHPYLCRKIRHASSCNQMCFALPYKSTLMEPTKPHEATPKRFRQRLPPQITSPESEATRALAAQLATKTTLVNERHHPGLAAYETVSREEKDPPVRIRGERHRCVRNSLDAVSRVP